MNLLNTSKKFDTLYADLSLVTDMFPSHINPTPYYRIIASFLTGPELASLNWVNQEFNDFCNDEIEFYKKLKNIDVLDIPKYFKNNGCHPLNLIFVTRPICCSRYPDPEKFGESDDKPLDTDKYCYGSIFTHKGKNYCEGCLTEQYGEGWKRWKGTQLPRIAMHTNHYLTIHGILVNRRRHVEGPTHYEDGVEVDFDGEPITRGYEYWLKDQTEEQKRQSCYRRLWFPRSSTHTRRTWDDNCDVIFKGPSTPKECDNDDLRYYLKQKYKDECVMSGLKVGRLRLPVVSDDSDIVGYSDDSDESEYDETRRDFWTIRENRYKYMEASLFLNNYEYDVHDLEVLV